MKNYRLILGEEKSRMLTLMGYKTTMPLMEQLSPSKNASAEIMSYLNGGKTAMGRGSTEGKVGAGQSKHREWITNTYFDGDHERWKAALSKVKFTQSRNEAESGNFKVQDIPIATKDAYADLNRPHPTTVQNTQPIFQGTSHLQHLPVEGYACKPEQIQYCKNQSQYARTTEGKCVCSNSPHVVNQMSIGPQTGPDLPSSYYNKQPLAPVIQTDKQRIDSQNKITSKLQQQKFDDLGKKPKNTHHFLLAILEIGLWIASPICPVCPFMAMGVGAMDAAKYADEGEYQMAGMMGVLSLLPGIKHLKKVIPGLTKVTKTDMLTLGNKVKRANTGGQVTLTPLENQIINGIKQNKQQVKQEVKTVLKSNAEKIIAAKTTKPTLKKKMINFTKELAGTAVAGGAGYDMGAAYVESGKGGPKALLKSKGYDVTDEGWNNIKARFGSSGSAEDGELMTQAILNGWEPGQEVPEKFRTDTQLEKIASQFDLPDGVATREEVDNWLDAGLGEGGELDKLLSVN
jgi:hypothetical protein